MTSEGAAASGVSGAGGAVAEYRRMMALLRVREYQREVYESGARFKVVVPPRVDLDRVAF